MRFTGLVKVTAVVEVPIEARSWEDALEKAQKLRLDECVEPTKHNGFIDSELPILESLGKD